MFVHTCIYVWYFPCDLFLFALRSFWIILYYIILYIIMHRGRAVFQSLCTTIVKNLNLKETEREKGKISYIILDMCQLRYIHCQRRRKSGKGYAGRETKTSLVQLNPIWFIFNCVLMHRQRSVAKTSWKQIMREAKLSTIISLRSTHHHHQPPRRAAKFNIV